MCMSFCAPPCGFDPLGPFQPSQTEVQLLQRREVWVRSCRDATDYGELHDQSSRSWKFEFHV